MTGWTLVTRSAKQMRRMVQIFVKVDGMNTVEMEVSPEDKVQKILNIVSGSDWDGVAGFETGGHEQDARWRKTQRQKG